MKSFQKSHPLINLSFFVFTFFCGMVYLHPVLLGISFVSSLLYAISLKGFRQVGRYMLIAVPLMIFSIGINVLFNHKGVTTLIENGYRPITLESLIYGIVSSVMVVTILLWFFSFHEIMTSDKLIYLFGKWCPNLSLVLSMVLAFVPKTNKRFEVIRDARKGMGIGRDGTIVEKAKNTKNMLSILTTWVLEDSMDTAASMKSRGYGLGKRTSYTNIRFRKRDGIVLCCLTMLGVGFFVAIANHGATVYYFPEFYFSNMSAQSVLGYISYALFLNLPYLYDTMEGMKWRYIQSKI